MLWLLSVSTFAEYKAFSLATKTKLGWPGSAATPTRG